MNEFRSRSSNQVKLITVGGLLSLPLIMLSLFVKMKIFGIVITIIIVLLVVSIFLYFYSKSLVKIIIDDKFVVLKKNIGFDKIYYEEIKCITKLEYSEIPMTVGSKGFFGFIGTTMDNSYSYVKNRNEMIRISTKDRKYLVSCENPDNFIEEMRERIKNNASL